MKIVTFQLNDFSEVCYIPFATSERGEINMKNILYSTKAAAQQQLDSFLKMESGEENISDYVGSNARFKVGIREMHVLDEFKEAEIEGIE